MSITHVFPIAGPLDVRKRPLSRPGVALRHTDLADDHSAETGSSAQVLLRLLQVDPAASEAASAQLHVLCERERATASAFRFDSDRNSYQVAHVGLRVAAAELTSARPEDVRFGRARCPVCHGPGGRPTLATGAGLQFSLSRTRRLVAIAFSFQPVGVDVEAGRVVDDVGVVNALHPREKDALRRLDPDVRGQAVQRCWVRKEAILKATGAGIAHGVREPYVGFDNSPDGEVGCAGWSIRSLPLPAGAAGAVAVRR